MRATLLGLNRRLLGLWDVNRRTIRVRGRGQIIGPGLAAQAEIKTGERRIIDFLLSPIAQTIDEAGRER